MRNYNHSYKNNLKYPIELHWRSRIWTLKEGDRLAFNREFYIVTRVNRSVVPGELPTIEVAKEITENGTTKELRRGVGQSSDSKTGSQFR